MVASEGWSVVNGNHFCRLASIVLAPRNRRREGEERGEAGRLGVLTTNPSRASMS